MANFFLIISHHHHHLFLKRPFLPRSARVRRFSRYEVSPHIPEHYPAQGANPAAPPYHPSHIPSKSSCPYPHISPLPPPHFYRPTPISSPLLRSTCPNHLNLPRLTSLSPFTLNPQKTVQIHTALSILQRHPTHPWSPSFVPFSTSAKLG